jgi:Uma2 family endonuclease
MTVEDFLAFEKDNPVRHEYVAGEVYAVAGPRLRHNLISTNILTRLRAPARARGCRVYIENVLVRIAHDVMYYPDITVVCREPGLEQWIAEHPSVVVEVTSPSTRGVDRREKLANYRKLASVEHYIIVEQRRREVSVYSRAANGEWDRTEFVQTGTIDIASLGCSLTLDEIYDDVPMPPMQIAEGPLAEFFDPDDIEDDEDDEPWR